MFEVIGSLWSLFEGTFEIFFISANFSNIQVDKDSSEKTMPWISFKLKSNGAFLKIFFFVFVFTAYVLSQYFYFISNFECKAFNCLKINIQLSFSPSRFH